MRVLGRADKKYQKITPYFVKRYLNPQALPWTDVTWRWLGILTLLSFGRQRYVKSLARCECSRGCLESSSEFVTDKKPCKPYKPYFECVCPAVVSLGVSGVQCIGYRV